MIKYTTGDMLVDSSEALVNTVNCVGVMGRGIALQFKKTFPENFSTYAAACKQGELEPGKMFVFETRTLTNPRYIVNFPTKRHWKGKSRIEDIESGLQALVEEMRTRNIRSIAIPPLGSGLGGLNWTQVRALIEEKLSDIPDLEVTVYEPKGAPPADVMARIRDVPNMTPGRAALVALIQRYLGGFMDPSVTLLEVHKLMYFMQEAGQPLKLKYAKAPYGPYAENLRHVLNIIEGHFVSGYVDGGDAPDKKINLVPGATGDAESFLEGKQETKQRLQRVADLVDGFETPFGLELLATVHWVVSKMNAGSIEDVIAKVYGWNDRKKNFSERQIKVSYNVLKQQGWLV